MCKGRPSADICDGLPFGEVHGLQDLLAFRVDFAAFNLKLLNELLDLGILERVIDARPNTLLLSSQTVCRTGSHHTRGDNKPKA